MAPKKDISLLGAVQSHGDGWRAEVNNIGKGPSRALHAEAYADLALARQARTRGEMGRILSQLVLAQPVAANVVGQPLAANVHCQAPPVNIIGQPLGAIVNGQALALHVVGHKPRSRSRSR